MKLESWTLDFFREWYPQMDLRSVARLRSYTLRRGRDELRPEQNIVLRMKRPFEGTVRLREWGTDIYTFEEIAVREIYKSVITGILVPRTVIDLGANIGLASLYFAHHWPSCKILAVEPNPETCDVLLSNLKPLSRAGRCKMLQAAVWSTSTQLSYYQQPGRFSTFSVHETIHGEKGSGTVSGQTMAEVIRHSGFTAIDLLKVDIEGAEAQLFAGNVDWLSSVGSIAIEFHGNSREVSSFDEITEAHGFQSCSEGDHTVLVSKLSQRSGGPSGRSRF